MIVVVIRGGLGNQMFQYAAAKALAAKHNTRLKLDLSRFSGQRSKGRGYVLDRFNIGSNDVLSRFDELLLKLRKPNVYREDLFCFDPNFFRLPRWTRLVGHFQSAKYFDSLHQEIRSCFSFRNLDLTEQAANTLSLIEASNSVSVHVRRGDYLNHSFLNICDTAYYENAFTEMETRVTEPHYFLFSDDIAWVKENFPSIEDRSTFVELDEGNDRDLLEFRLMQACKHNIIPNSTFSWWAAWLNSNPEKFVIAPNRWFASDAGPRYEKQSDMTPEEWIKVDLE